MAEQVLIDDSIKINIFLKASVMCLCLISNPGKCESPASYGSRQNVKQKSCQDITKCEEDDKTFRAKTS